MIASTFWPSSCCMFETCLSGLSASSRATTVQPYCLACGDDGLLHEAEELVRGDRVLEADLAARAVLHRPAFRRPSAAPPRRPSSPRGWSPSRSQSCRCPRWSRSRRSVSDAESSSSPPHPTAPRSRSDEREQLRGWTPDDLIPQGPSLVDAVDGDACRRAVRERRRSDHSAQSRVNERSVALQASWRAWNERMPKPIHSGCSQSG